MEDNNAARMLSAESTESCLMNIVILLEKVANSFLISSSDAVSQDNLLEWTYLNEIILLEISAAMRQHIVPQFWSYFILEQEDLNALNPMNQTTATIPFQYEYFKKFVSAVKELETSFNTLREINRRLLGLNAHLHEANAKRDHNKLLTILHETLLGQKPPYFNYVVHAFYNVSFRVFSNLYLPANTFFTTDIPVHCNGCNIELEDCQCHYYIEVSNEVNKSLLEMQLLDRIAGQTMTSLVQKRIKEHISDSCQGVYDRSHLKELEVWLDSVIISGLTRIFNNGNLEIEATNDNKSTIESFKVKLTFFLYENYAYNLIDQFFSIIIDFPDSIPAIDDLKICMEKIEIRKYLIRSLKNSFEARILHPGVNTMDILTGYIAAIKAIRHLDSSGVILETVTEPIKDYLRKRTDTVRRVVTGLTEEGPTDLSEELARAEMLKENMGTAGTDDFNNWETWLPDPFGFETSSRAHTTNANRSADIISMVVDIYGSKELFMNEYRNLLADRLLTQLDFNPEKEIRNLELLKLRFGENLLHTCEVMLKDVADSKRINAHIQSDTKYKNSKEFDISSLIISAQFWPTFNKESLEIPDEIKEEFEKYTTAYEAYKGNRTLNWRNVTGRVNLVVELGDRVMEFNVPPTQAVIIYNFQKKDQWTLDELSIIMRVPTTILRRRISFWQSHGLVKEVSPGTFRLIEEKGQKTTLDDVPSAELLKDDEDIESAMASASDQREEELQVFWSYIVGMLTNLDSLPIERIHQMLKLFATHGIGVEFSQDELKDFLQRKVREHKLLFSGGVYQLPK